MGFNSGFKGLKQVARNSYITMKRMLDFKLAPCFICNAFSCGYLPGSALRRRGDTHKKTHYMKRMALQQLQMESCQTIKRLKDKKKIKFRKVGELGNGSFSERTLLDGHTWIIIVVCFCYSVQFRRPQAMPRICLLYMPRRGQRGRLRCEYISQYIWVEKMATVLHGMFFST